MIYTTFIHFCTFNLFITTIFKCKIDFSFLCDYKNIKIYLFSLLFDFKINIHKKESVLQKSVYGTHFYSCLFIILQTLNAYEMPILIIIDLQLITYCKSFFMMFLFFIFINHCFSIIFNRNRTFSIFSINSIITSSFITSSSFTR